MTTITIFQNHSKDITGFKTKGHAGYADYGEDIVCAGISALTINAINSIEEYTDVAFAAEANDKTGDILFQLKEDATAETNLLLKSMVLGLTAIQNDYGKKFLTLHFKEV